MRASDGGTDVVILHGEAHPVPEPQRALSIRLSEMSLEKYGYGPKPDEVANDGSFVFRPQVVFAWSQFPKDVTRWTTDLLNCSRLSECCRRRSVCCSRDR